MRHISENNQIDLQVQDFDDLRTQYYHGIITPSDVNNVDVTVSANALYGITNGILSGLATTEVLEDPEIQVIIWIRIFFFKVMMYMYRWPSDFLKTW